MFTHRAVSGKAEFYMELVNPVLDHGYVKLVDYMGSETSIVDAARVSYNNIHRDWSLEGVKKDAKLIHYLMKHGHTSPFEHVIMTFEVKLPIFVAREWVRHRTARLNEVSGRYSELPMEFYVPGPSRIQRQDKKNKQSSAEPVEEWIALNFISEIMDQAIIQAADYELALSRGIAREVARIGLPLNLYTKWVWQCDLHNLLHFLKLRMSPDAQWEIRQYANVIGAMVKECFPNVWEAFDEYVLGAVTVPKSEANKLVEKPLDNVVPSMTSCVSEAVHEHKSNGKGDSNGNQEAQQGSGSVVFTRRQEIDGVQYVFVPYLNEWRTEEEAHNV